MWISSFCTLMVTLLIRVIEGITKQQPCCTGVFTRSIASSNNWHKGLQEAVYHSLTQHSAFDGSLDDRVERDRRLWKRIQAAEFSPELSATTETQSGLLVNADHFLEFHPSSYTCHERDCKKSIMAIWEMRKTDHPRGYYILVKLPVSHTYVQDSYEYTSHDGLKHLGAENVHKQHIYHYTIGTDGKQSFNKAEQRRFYKPIKFPSWTKQKADYEISRKDFNNVDKKDNSKEGNNEGGDKIVRIEPRRKFSYIDPSKAKKQGLVVAYIPENSQREFQIPDQKYDGFLPLIHALSKGANDQDTYRDTSQEKDYDVRRLKVYEDVIKKYINEQRNRPKIPSDFRPSRPYIQYSEPDPLYIPPSYESSNEQKPNIDENKFVIIHKYPDSISSQLPIGNVAGITPTVPYISVTVSNKIPVQNINHIDLSTTTKTTTSSTTLATTPTSTGEPVINTTNADVEVITISNNTIITTREPPKSVATTTTSIDTSREELTTISFHPTTILIKSNGIDVSTEESSTLDSMQSRNLIKKDTSSKTSSIGLDNNGPNGDNYNAPVTINHPVAVTDNYSSFTESTTVTSITSPADITVTAEFLIQSATENTNNANQSLQDVQFRIGGLDEMVTNSPLQITTELNFNLPTEENIQTIANINLKNDYANSTLTEHNTEIKMDVTESTTQAITESLLVTTTTTPELTTTNNYYLEEAKSQLADLFASITFDLFNSPSPSESDEEDPINYSALLSAVNQQTVVDSTNYDDFLNVELAEPSNQNQRQLKRTASVDEKSSRNNTLTPLSSRQYTNSH